MLDYEKCGKIRDYIIKKIIKKFKIKPDDIHVDFYGKPNSLFLYENGINITLKFYESKKIIK